MARDGPGALGKIVTVLVVVVILGGLAYGVLQIANRGDERAQPSPSASPSGSPSPSPSPTLEPATYEIKTAGSCLRIRELPSLSAPLVNCLDPGLVVRGDGRIRRGDGLRWAYVTWVANPKTRGWAALKYLKKIDDGA